MIGFVAKKVNLGGARFKKFEWAKNSSPPMGNYKSSNAELMIIKLFEQNSSEVQEIRTYVIPKREGQ